MLRKKKFDDAIEALRKLFVEFVLMLVSEWNLKDFMSVLN